MATAASKLENPTDLSSTPSNAEDAAPAPLASSGGEESESKQPEKGTKGEDDVSDVKKKMKRAERFGVPVHLSEQEKRDSRAERFGTGGVGSGLDCPVNSDSEELKKKARAERFGFKQCDAADDESEKKARLARFGAVSPNDCVEEEKKKARALSLIIVAMEKNPNDKFPESSPVGNFQIPGEPAIVINDLHPTTSSLYSSDLISFAVDNSETRKVPRFGKWFEGREVTKMFGDRFFRGEVTRFDEEMGWYRVVYEDGDFEDLEWSELEEVLVPLDVNVPLRTLALKTLKKRPKNVRIQMNRRDE